jgi:hypothetical protein
MRGSHEATKSRREACPPYLEERRRKARRGERLEINRYSRKDAGGFCLPAFLFFFVSCLRSFV